MQMLVRLMAASLVLVLAACEPSAPPQTGEGVPAQRSESTIPLGQLPGNVEPLHYRIDLTINPDQLRYEGVVEIDIELKAPRREFYIHGKDLKVENITARLQNKTIIKGTYAQVHDSGVARLTFEQQIPRGKMTVRLPYSAAFETSPDALTSMPDNGAKYVWSQFEAISARRAFPGFDEPRFKTPFDISITAIARDITVSNTLPVAQEKISEGVIKTTFATTAPLPTYLIAIAVGPYDVVKAPPIAASTLRATPLPLRAVTVAGKGERARFALTNTQPLVRYLEDYFAAPFPYPKLDLITPPNFVAGGMENAGAITYTERAILFDQTSSVQQKRNFTLLHGHELAHQWFGDLVTPKWWNDIWLNEAFATWMGNKAALTVWPQGEFDRETTRDALEVMDLDALNSARAIRQPIKTNDDINNAFDGLTYKKGGGVLAMFEAYLGADAFREGVRIHMRRFAHGTADVRDFMDSLVQGSKRPEIVAAFETFLNQPGVPIVRLKTACNSQDLEVSLTQSPYGANTAQDKRMWSIPVCVRDLVKGKPIPCTMLSQRLGSFTLKKQCNAVLMPNAYGAGYYRFTSNAAEWQKLLALTTKMTAAEQLSTLHALRAAFRAGDVDAKTYLETLRTTGTAGNWDVTDIVRTFLTEMRGDLLSKPDLGLFEQTTRSWFEKPLAKVGLVAKRNETPASTLMRATLADLMVKVARDPVTLSALAVKGTNHFKVMAAGQADNAIPPELVAASLWAAVNTGGLPVAQDAMVAIKASTNAEFRNAAIRALTGVRDKAAIAEVQEFAISGALRLRELSTFLREAFADSELRDTMWTWFRKDFKRITAPVPEGSRARFVDLPSRLCSNAAHAEIEKFFKPMAGKIVGAPRRLANALELVENCAMWRKAKGPELAAALQSLPR